jgi:hypothetical protein
MGESPLPLGLGWIGPGPNVLSAECARLLMEH